MNVFTLNEAFQYVDDKYLDIAEQERVRKVRRRSGNRHGWIAACIIGLILILGLPAAAIAANWFGLRDLIIPKTPYSSGTGASPSGEMNTDPDASPEGGGDVCIGLSGYQGSAEAQALAEWQAFLADYDSDHAILNEIGNGETGLEDRYGLYYVYSQDMADKLEEIVQKYHLKLHSQINDVSQEELEYRVGGKFLPDQYAKYWGYIYEDGSFRFDGGILGDDGEQKAAYQFARTVKGTFDEVILNVGNVQDFQEFSYVTAKGEAVMIAMGEDVSLIYLDAESCFIVMHFLNRFSCEITKEQLMEIADDIDFALLKNVRVPEMRGDSIPSGMVEPEETVVYSDELSELVDSEQVQKVVEEFAIAYFSGDVSAVKSLLPDSYAWDIEVYEDTGKISEIMVKNLPDGRELELGSVWTVSVQYRDSAHDDMFQYLTCGLIKQSTGWEIQFYGMEG